ncbi:Chromo domain-containing protein [Abeliophyllum distichum]|uniref:Chromo domain-containing protein n=1 Tax=Abeliophyllum distichum TaxID=126358 RepID=A0ABD1Q5D7_9LAMI
MVVHPHLRGSSQVEAIERQPMETDKVSKEFRTTLKEAQAWMKKKKISEQVLVQSKLPVVKDDDLCPRPQAVLDKRVHKKKMQILVHWQGLSPAELTWEDLAAMKEQFPDFVLEDKAAF